MLNYASVSLQLINFYVGQKLTENNNLGAKQPFFPPDPVYDAWVLKFVDVYDADSIAGTTSQPSVSLVSMKNLLYFNVSNSTLTSTNFATVVSNYWKQQITPGAPILCGGTIVSIVNDAEKIKSPIENYMKTLISNEKLPYYEHLFSFVEAQVNSIIWTVTELDGAGCAVPTNYSVTVS